MVHQTTDIRPWTEPIDAAHTHFTKSATAKLANPSANQMQQHLYSLRECEQDPSFRWGLSSDELATLTLSSCLTAPIFWSSLCFSWLTWLVCILCKRLSTSQTSQGLHCLIWEYLKEKYVINTGKSKLDIVNSPELDFSQKETRKRLTA